MTLDLTNVSDVGLLDDLRQQPNSIEVLNEIARRFHRMVSEEDSELQPFVMRKLHKLQGGKVGRIFDGAASGICKAIADRGPNKKGEGPSYTLTMQMKLKGVFEFDEEARANHLAGIEVADIKVTSKVPPATVEPVLIVQTQKGQMAFNVDGRNPHQKRLPKT